MRSVGHFLGLLAITILVGGGLLTPARAQVAGLNIYQATLLEADQRTGEVSTDDLKEILAGGGLVYDSRPPLQYAIGHIPGALSGPAPGVQSVVAAHVAGIQQLAPGADTAIVLYCNGVY